jgi:ribosomal protein L2
MKTQYPKTHNPEKSLIKILKKHSGRDHFGHVSVRHRAHARSGITA